MRPVKTCKPSTNSHVILPAWDNLIVYETKKGPLNSGSPLITTSICPLNFKCPVSQQAPTNYVSDTFEGSKNQDIAIICGVLCCFLFFFQPFPSVSAQNNDTNAISRWHIYPMVPCARTLPKWSIKVGAWHCLRCSGQEQSACSLKVLTLHPFVFPSASKTSGSAQKHFSLYRNSLRGEFSFLYEEEQEEEEEEMWLEECLK